ncbi:hypothetical protein HDU98_004255 [Podochytrium sp. JEL0797]|nr:hypothetical protein HDU98_004255 [Podochytrium sp. JEL0797]
MDEFVDDLKRYDEARKHSDLCSVKINKVHGKIVKSDKFSTKVAKKLLEIYQEATASASLEKRMLDELISDVTKLEGLVAASSPADSTERKKKRKSDDRTSVGPASNGSGSSIAKRSKTEDEGSPQLLAPLSQVVVRPAEDFILANVIRYHPDKQKYEVEDADADDPVNARKKYLFSTKQIIPITDSPSRPDFPEGHTVLALYPQTTCFYKAVVIVPAGRNPGRFYSVQFDDDGNVDRSVLARFCLDYPKSRKSG